MTILKGYFDYFKDCLIEGLQETGTFLVNIPFWKINEIENSDDKSGSWNAISHYEKSSQRGRIIF